MVQVDPNETVRGLKGLIESEVGRPVNRLQFLGENLEDDASIADCAIGAESTLLFVLRRPPTACFMCEAKFEDPRSSRLLGCGHTLCQACVKRASDEKSLVVCPADSHPTAADNILCNFASCKFFAEPSAEAKRMCESCGDHPATWVCMDCGEGMCDDLQPAHGKARATKGSALLPRLCLGRSVC